MYIHVAHANLSLNDLNYEYRYQSRVVYARLTLYVLSLNPPQKRFPNALSTFAFLICAIISVMVIQKRSANPGHETSGPMKQGTLALAVSRSAIWAVYPSAILAVMLKADSESAITKTILLTIAPACLGSVAQIVFWKPTGESIDGRSMLLRSIIGATVANFVTGFARNTIWVSCACFLIGMSLDNGTEVNRMNEELVGKQSANKNTSLPTFAFAISMFSGVLIEFLLRDPVTRLPQYFGSSWLLEYFPNLLPSLCLIPFLVAATVCFKKLCSHLGSRHSKE